MKILFVITKAVVGGAQTSVLNLAREMKRRGHEVTVGFGDGDWLPVELDKEKISYVRFRNLKRTHNPLANIFFILELKKFLRGNSPLLSKEGSGDGYNVVHFNSSNALPGAIGAKLAGRKIKTIFTFRGMSMLDEHYRTNPIKKFAYRLFFKFCLLFVDAPVFVSRENWEKFGRGQLTKLGFLIYNGLDPEQLNFVMRAEAIKFFSQKTGRDLAGKYLLGSIGRLDYAKNYEFLINIFPKILNIRSDAALVIMGEGLARARYENLIRDKGLAEKIFLLGNVENGGRYLRGFDLFVQPSRYEGLSIALIEALFAGSLILTSDVGGNREVVGGSNEEIYRLDDEAEFLAKFQALQDIDLWPKIIHNNAGQALKFRLTDTADGYEKIYQEK